jgi:hypothetical protein
MKNRKLEFGVGNSISRKYAINETFFDELNADSAYVLGYIWTDGCIKEFGRGSWGILLECSLKDREILDGIKKVMNSEAPVRTRRRKVPSGKEIEMSKLCLYSNRLCKALMKYGIIPRKSKADPLPVGIPDELVFHFIRGVLDGDGSVGKDTRNKSLFRLTFAGKSKLLRWIDFVFFTKLGTKPRRLYLNTPTPQTRSDCWHLVYSRQGDIRKIFSALHGDCHLFLARKNPTTNVA